MAVLALCGTAMSLQQTIVVPLLPDLPRLLDTSPENAAWLVTAALLSGAVATPIAGRLADMYGKRMLLVACLAIMVTGSLWGALSDSLLPILGARVLQGVGVALVPVGIAAMRDELPREQLPMGVALMSATLAIGSAAGLPLSGVVLEYLDWHAVFWLTAPVVLVDVGGDTATALGDAAGSEPPDTTGQEPTEGARRRTGRR